MIVTIVVALILLIGVGLFIGEAIFDMPGGKIGGVVAVLIAVIALGLSSTVIVPARAVGVPVTFGVVGEPLSNGLHWKAPWTSVETMPTTPQSLDSSEDNPTIAKDKSNAEVFVHNNVRWEIVDEQAAEVYYDAKEFEAVSDLLVQPKLREAVGSVMATYEPLADDKPNLEQVAEAIKIKMQAGVGERINVISVSVTLIDTSESTKNRINQLNTEKGNTRIAEQRIKTAEAEARANEVLSKSVSNNPNVLVSKCLDQIAEGKTLPAGFQCWPGTGGSVVLPSASVEKKE